MSHNQLLEVSLVVEDEMVEPVAEVLSRYVKGGVAIESTAVAGAMEEAGGKSIGPLRVYGYISMDDRLEENRQRLEEAIWYLSRIRPLPEPQFQTIEESDWSQAWKKHYHPIPIGKKLMIVPAWLDIPPGKDHSIPIQIDPGMAFGTGTHPTTQLCLEFVEDIMMEFDLPQIAGGQSMPKPASDIDVIDIGCGTAILSIAALKLGAGRALAVDIDPDAIRAAHENAETNQVKDRLELGVGSLERVQKGDYSIDKARLVLANILAPVCIRLLDEGMAHLLTHDGVLVLSGILDEQALGVEAAATRSGLRLGETRQIGDWVALKFSFGA